MATNVITLETTGEAVNPVVLAPLFEFPDYAVPFTLKDQVRNLLLCVQYDFRFPITTHGRYPLGYDSHQVCQNTGVERFFNSKTWAYGPMYHYRPVK